MDTVMAIALLMILTLMMMTLVVLLLVALRIKRVLTRALTFVFTLSLKPRWKKLR